MSELPGMAWGPTAGGGGKLNVTKVTKAGPYRGDRASSGISFLGLFCAPVQILLLDREGESSLGTST